MSHRDKSIVSQKEAVAVAWRTYRGGYIHTSRPEIAAEWGDGAEPLYAFPAPAGEPAPVGWKLVPLEPMPEMLGAWYRYKNGHHFHDEPPPQDTSDYGAYRAMLAAAPSPSPTPAGEPSMAVGAVETLIESLQEGLMTDAGLDEAERVAMRHQIIALETAVAAIRSALHSSPTPVSAPVGVVEALRGLVRAVENMRVPQTVEDAALQIHVTIGPALEAAQAALHSREAKHAIGQPAPNPYYTAHRMYRRALVAPSASAQGGERG